jgi:hypothetical protein
VSGWGQRGPGAARGARAAAQGWCADARRSPRRGFTSSQQRAPSPLCPPTRPHSSTRRAAEATGAEDAKELITKTLPRLALFGALPPSILPVLLSVRKALDVHKGINKKLLRLTYYLIQLVCGDGSAGTVLPFSLLAGGCGATAVVVVGGGDMVSGGQAGAAAQQKQPRAIA